MKINVQLYITLLEEKVLQFMAQPRQGATANLLGVTDEEVRLANDTMNFRAPKSLDATIKGSN